MVHGRVAAVAGQLGVHGKAWRGQVRQAESDDRKRPSTFSRDVVGSARAGSRGDGYDKALAESPTDPYKTDGTGLDDVEIATME